MKYTGGVCPVHGFEKRDCWDGCLPERVEHERAASQLNGYWLSRRRGVVPCRNPQHHRNCPRHCPRPPLEPVAA